MSALHFRSMQTLGAQYRNGECAPEQVCGHMLDEIHARNPSMGALTAIAEDTAREEAAAASQRWQQDQQLSPVDGMPLVIKDLIDTAPLPCPAGLDHLAQYRPKLDAPVVRSLRDAGAIILGVTATDSGAFGVRTPQVRHPALEGRTVGGSSGGTGAAVAAGLACAGIGTDTGGSIRIPSACCAIAGFKPTWGRVPAAGVRPLAWSLDHVGSMARCVADLEAMQQVIDPLFDPNPSIPELRGITIGVCTDYFQDAADGIKQTFMQVIDQCTDLGVSIRAVSLPTPDAVMRFHLANLPSEAAAYHFFEFPDDWPSYPSIARETLEAAKPLRGYDHVIAERSRADARNLVDRLFHDVDVLMVPTLPVHPPKLTETEVNVGGQAIPTLLALIRYTALFNQTGHPVVSLPMRTEPSSDLYCSAQLVGPRDQDARLLKLAACLEEALGTQVNHESLIPVTENGGNND